MPKAEATLLEAIDRFESVFSVFRLDSELARWRLAGEVTTVSEDLGHLLRLALGWQQRSSGVFNPAAGILSARWARAEIEKIVPSTEELRTLAGEITKPRYSIDGKTVTKLADCSSLNFNAIAKGLVVDLASNVVMEKYRLSTLLVNVGGDLVHHGQDQIVVAIEDPRRPYDNAESLTRVPICGQGLATSGSARRGFRIRDRWFSHVLDTRTGQPVDTVLSATVIGPDAATADVVATAASVLSPADGIAFVETVENTSALVVGEATVMSSRWPRTLTES